MQSPVLSRIMIVEDSFDIQLAAQVAMQHFGGFTVELCSSGIEALDKVEEFQPDLILLDVMMPEMDGMETLRALRQKPQSQIANTPVIFVTARGGAQAIAEYMNLGALDVILKPFQPKTLATQVKHIWERHTFLHS